MGIASGELTTLALCWRVVRPDGAALGFTAHDRDLLVGGLRYRATPGMAPSAVTAGDGLDAESLDVAGALSADAITAADLEAGRWDGAALRLFAVSWEDPEGERIHLARGELGAVSRTGARFEAELRGPAAAFDVPVCEATSPECRAELGDRRCRVDMVGRTTRVRVAACDAAGSVTIAGGVELGRFRWGQLRWIDGENSGLTGAVVDTGPDWVRLRDGPVFAVVPGVAAELTEGCDKRLETCRVRFANTANFRGEPHLPGNDLLTRYPGA